MTNSSEELGVIIAWNASSASGKAEASRAIKRLFKRAGADLFPLTHEGHAYFVPQEYEGLLSEARDVLLAKGGRGSELLCFPTHDSPGVTCGFYSVIQAGLLGMVEDHLASCRALKPGVRPSAIELRIDRGRILHAKLLAYRQFITKENLDYAESRLASIGKQLRNILMPAFEEKAGLQENLDANGKHRITTGAVSEPVPVAAGDEPAADAGDAG